MPSIDLPPSVDEAKARLLLAVALFQEGEVSVGQGAEIAGLSYRAFADALMDRGVPLTTYTEEMLEEDFAFAREFSRARGH
ncbi:UPF0175 family protein [Rubrivirga sp. S365]|uniref:UPF0175 family protein n=1 Tax=Rubrivirga litoralis TaxID=3075598 RepID=A0ABU3BLS1_9BACT|nr:MULTISPECIES: UPF0175 family protein [unclassified Rubrivirga]MDT0630239.1 UPF0175 family protein [Rubrivirga sp. F394]MDT7855750.1 UPF0175 family protein [Rubrivirga sp. S365]